VRVLFTLTLATLALTSAVARGDAAVPATVTVHVSAYGRVLFDARGFALYAFTRDAQGRSACSGACARRWPPYVIDRSPLAGRGVAAAKLGAITRADGRRQVTYAGRPLYRYLGDRRPLQILCQNVREFGGLWLVVRPGGGVVR